MSTVGWSKIFVHLGNYSTGWAEMVIFLCPHLEKPPHLFWNAIFYGQLFNFDSF